MFAGILFLIIIYMLRTEFFRIFPSTDLIALSKRELRISGIEAIKKGDEPISAIILYNYSVIGRGHNTLLSDTNAVGHAEINALNNAIKNLGWNQFNSLDKNSLIIMTTTEPCQFCQAVLQEYGISKVEFMKKRSLDYWLKAYWESIAFELKKRKLEPSELQDSLDLLKSNPNSNLLQ